MDAPPLSGLRVLELAGLAPAPFTGMLLADWGATVLRIDRPPSEASLPTSDQLVRRKSSILLDLKLQSSVKLLHSLLAHVDVFIDPYRPGVLEKLGLDPRDLVAQNPRLIVARLTGFRPPESDEAANKASYSHRAGHDINYISLSGALSLFGPADRPPTAPANLLADFAGGGSVCFMGILLALIHRARTGKGQIVDANMVDGSAYLATMARLASKTPFWDAPRGENPLDGGCPFYQAYETKDGLFVAVGALEEKFFSELLHGLDLTEPTYGDRWNKQLWPKQKALLTATFKTKTRAEWEGIFIGKDACVTPVLTHSDLQQRGFKQRPIVHLSFSPGLAIEPGPSGGQGPGVHGSGWSEAGLLPGHNGESILTSWTHWQRGHNYTILQNGTLTLTHPTQSKL
ncbi:putative isopenicillin n-CoA epimerase [Piedraia hortae CBS 480.64]|uniref:Putative isopenicillin n-CoA epimerase n=1 Tax=Piedraia hortae CBS 480.64 TaxID=1314780 RepID=A0A6A7BTS0_9PEZI|nr:putative isopenicillin n-CoA epimerase [Piedraia hortae CBS 480.64]